jgi:hypothetical protein
MERVSASVVPEIQQTNVDVLDFSYGESHHGESHVSIRHSRSLHLSISRTL